MFIDKAIVECGHGVVMGLWVLQSALTLHRRPLFPQQPHAQSLPCINLLSMHMILPALKELMQYHFSFGSGMLRSVKCPPNT